MLTEPGECCKLLSTKSSSSETSETKGSVMRLKLTLALAVVLALGGAYLLAGCGSSSSPTNSASSVSGTSNATFTYDTYTEVMNDWDPASAYATELIAMHNMYDTLTRYNDVTGKAEPLLATSWTSSDGGKLWTYTLRQGVTFHTGRPLTAAAVKECLDRTIKLGQGAAYMFSAVTSITTPNDHTVVFHLKYPAPMDLITAASYSAYIYDAKAAGSADLKKWFAAGHDAGTGPYTVDSWHAGQEVELTLKVVPNYWSGWSGAHYQRVVFRVVRQDTTAVQLVRSGQVSFVEQLSPQLFQSLQNVTGLHTYTGPSWANLILYFNTKTGPLANLKVRQAVASAIDYGGILAALPGVGERTPGIVPKGLAGYSASLPIWTYDVTRAKQLLAQAGYGPSKAVPALKITFTQGDSDEQLICSLIKSELAQVGIKVSVSGLTTATKYAASRSSNPAAHPDMTMLYWWPDYPDPWSWFVNLVHTEKQPFFNFAYYSNPTLDHQIDTVEQVLAVDRAKGESIYRQMQLEIYQAVPIEALYTQTPRRVILNSVGNYHDNPAYPEVVFVYNLQPK